MERVNSLDIRQRAHRCGLGVERVTTWVKKSGGAWPHCPFLLRRLRSNSNHRKEGFSIPQKCRKWSSESGHLCSSDRRPSPGRCPARSLASCLMVRRHFLLILLISGTNPPIPVCHRYFPTCIHVRAVANGRKTYVFRGRGSQRPTKGERARPFPAPSLQRVECSAHL
jgi:hypothetical protein